MMGEQSLLVNEIFRSIQGESTWAGLPCAFVRLKGCPLRCSYCDTSYAFHEGEKMSVDAIVATVQSFKIGLVEVTGGEPLIQQNVHPLMCRLCDMGMRVLLETSGQRDIRQCDPRVIRIIDIKTPNSGAADSFLSSNFNHLQPTDEIKFVITNREDFDWAIECVSERSLHELVHAIHFSPVMKQCGDQYIDGSDGLGPEILAQWLLETDKPIRLQLQVHKYIWSPEMRGV